eukprot:XP_013991921.1 PREDICTED: uncharacterized protein LOC106567309 [Salmo salar]
MVWSPFCHTHCLKSAEPAPGHLPGDSEGALDLSAISAEYQDLREVINKALAPSLLPHRSYDCRIDLLPSTTPPRGRLYSLSEGDQCYRELHWGLPSCRIYPYFVLSCLRPCIDYRGLNDITVKNRYPLPLIFSAFEPLQGATVFSKLDLRNTHLVRIREGDEWKIAFNMASGHYEYLVMPFGLTNAPAVFQALVNVLFDMLNRFVFVYIDDILIFSRSPKEHVLHVQQVPFTRSSAANRAFRDLKYCFTTAPILVHPDPSRQFVVEADASYVGVGTVLCQRSALDLKLHPCAFISHRLNATEKNYDLGNRELLANVKPDALSRCYSPTAITPEPKTILPTSCLATALSWGIESQEEEIDIPSAQMFVRRCRCAWRKARSALLKTTSRYRRQADRHRTLAPQYQRIQGRVKVKVRNNMKWQKMQWERSSIVEVDVPLSEHSERVEHSTVQQQWTQQEMQKEHGFALADRLTTS